MPLYTCHKCCKTFTQKWHYDYHMNRKRPCDTNANVNDTIQKSPEPEKTLKKPEILREFSYFFGDDPENSLKITEKLTCMFCHKAYSRQDNLKVHMDRYCKLRAKIEETNRNKEALLTLLIEQLKEQNQQHVKKIDELTEVIKSQQQQIMTIHHKGRGGRKKARPTVPTACRCWASRAKCRR